MRRRSMLLAGGAAAVALALGSLAGGVLAEPTPPPGPQSAPQALAERALGGPSGGATAGTVASLEDAVRAQPGDGSLLVQLGFAYQLRWRETSDASLLSRSQVAFERALRADAGEPNAVLGLGSLALIRHEFRAALGYGQRARRLLPGSGRPYAVIGDALIELGRYDAAVAAIQRGVTLRPGLAAYARVAYARELHGDLEGALAAMRLALDSAAGREPTAFALVEIAKLEVLLGRNVAARRHVRAALRALPEYPAARLELARSEARRGNLGRAIAAAHAAAAAPTPEAVALLADLLERSGRIEEARRQRATIAVMDRLLEANGVQVDLESATYRADLGIRLAETVALARRARAHRPSIFGDDAVGWALARAGRCAEALPFARRALRLGTRDPLLYFHLGYAEGCVGNAAARVEWYGRALALDREFSIRWAPVARAALASAR